MRSLEAYLYRATGAIGQVSFLIYYLVPAAFLMVAFISWLITRSAKARTGIDNVVLLLLLAMMVAMLIGPAYLYLATLNFTLGDVAIWEIAVFMSVGMMPVGVLLFAQYWMEGDEERKGPLPLSNLLRHASGSGRPYIILLLLSEVLMGWTFDLASGLVPLSQGIRCPCGPERGELQPHHLLVRLHDGRRDGPDPPRFPQE